MMSINIDSKVSEEMAKICENAYQNRAGRAQIRKITDGRLIGSCETLNRVRFELDSDLGECIYWHQKVRSERRWEWVIAS
jgi:hypothetical protein